MSVRAFTIQASDIARCSKQSILPAHYRDDGTCRCDEKDAAEAEVAAAEQAKRDANARLRRAREWLAST